MRISLTSYLQAALEEIAGGPVDLSAVHADVVIETPADPDRNAVNLKVNVAIAPDAGAAFRLALARAGLDDLKVFALSRAFDAVREGQ